MFTWKTYSVYVGESFEKFNEMRALLSHKNIDYKIKICSHNEAFISPGMGMGTGRTVLGDIQGKNNHNKIYEILISKKDVEKLSL